MLGSVIRRIPVLVKRMSGKVCTNLQAKRKDFKQHYQKIYKGSRVRFVTYMKVHYVADLRSSTAKLGGSVPIGPLYEVAS